MSILALAAPSPQHSGPALKVWSIPDLAHAVAVAGLAFPSAGILNPGTSARAAAGCVRRLWDRGELAGVGQVAVLLGIESGIVAADLAPPPIRIHHVSCQATDGLALKPSIWGPEAEGKLMRSLASLGTTWGAGLLEMPAVSWAVRSLSQLLGPASWYRLRVAQL